MQWNLLILCSSYFRNRILESPKKTKSQNQVIFGRTIDSLISQIIDNSLKDFVHPWMW